MKYKIGDHVRETGDGATGYIYKRGRVYDWFISKDKEGLRHLKCVYEKNVELVIKGGDMEKPYQRKTYRLKKDTYNMRKGALLQEACDDGTQPYQLITPEFHKGGASPLPEIPYRELVEDAPAFFEEVFQVSPQYMTADELAQWDAFKARKKPGRKAAVKTEKPVVALPNRAKESWTPARKKAQSAKLKAYWAAKKAA